MADVFISYRRNDREWVERISAVLHEKGYSVWWDSSLRAGELFDQKISTELETARCVVVIWSEAARASRWVKSEALEGYEKDALVAVRIDDVSLGRVFNEIHTTDLRSPEGMKNLVEGVVEKIGPPRPAPLQKDIENWGVLKRWWDEHDAFATPQIKSRIFGCSVTDEIDDVVRRVWDGEEISGNSDNDAFLTLISPLEYDMGAPPDIYYCETFLELVRLVFDNAEAPQS